MTAGRVRSQGFSLWRWSRRKLEAKTTSSPGMFSATSATAPAPTAASAAPAPLELPPVASLTFESDFAAFLRPGVDDTVKRAALKQLFRDPRFNVMDGLDTYIDDYTKAAPIAPDVLADLLQRGFGNAAEAGPQATPGVAAARAGAGVTAGTPSAEVECSAPTLTPEQDDPLSASGSDGGEKQGEAEQAGEGEPTDAQRTGTRQ